MLILFWRTNVSLGTEEGRWGRFSNNVNLLWIEYTLQKLDENIQRLVRASMIFIIENTDSLRFDRHYSYLYHPMYHRVTSKINVTPKGVLLPISKLHSNLLAHNSISQICYCSQISLQSGCRLLKFFWHLWG